MKLSSVFRLILALLLCAPVLYSQWFQQVSGTTFNLHSINSHHGNENFAWTCGDNGVILHTTNGGTNWTLQVSGTTNNLYGICFMESSAAPILAVGEGGIILRTTNFGANWLTITSPRNKTLRDISDFGFIAVGDSGTIIKSSDFGITWIPLPSPTTAQLNAVSAIFSNYIVGNNGTILKGSSGINWQLVTSGTNEDLLGVPLFGSSDLTVGTNGLIWRSSNSGNSWFAQNSNTTVTLRSVEYSVNNTSRIYICGDFGTILKSTNSGSNFGFQNSQTTQNLNSIFFYLGDNTGYSCGNNGVILKTTNGGGAIITSVNNNSGIPDEYKLEQNHPNPFNPVTNIRFSISSADITSIAIYDITGKQIEVLLERYLSAGEYEVTFDGSNYASGIYYYTMRSGKFLKTAKMILVK